MSDFIINIKEIAEKETVYSYGDRCLYRMSQEVLKAPDENKIASMIWLIGRSYSASPERITKAIDHNKYVNDKNKMPEIVFENMAKYLNDNIVNDKNSLYDQGYLFDSSDKDIKHLCDTIELVYRINESKCSINRATNMISFSSKFLHFCMPNRVFIYDQYSRKGTAALFGKHKRFDDACINEYTGKYIELKDEVNENITVSPRYNSENIEQDNELLKDYIRHVCGCYLLASIIHQSEINGIQIDENKYSIPRLVDSVLMDIGKKEYMKG